MKIGERQTRTPHGDAAALAGSQRRQEGEGPVLERAVLLASREGHVAVVFPMIASLDEWRTDQALVNEPALGRNAAGA